MANLSASRLVALADEIAVHAKNGSHWSKDRYDLERFERILTLATEILGETLHHDPADVARWYTDEPGTFTAKVGASVAAFDADGRLLMIQRRDNACWAMPGGIVEYGETVAEAAEREAWEEAGVEVRVHALLGIYETRRHGAQTIHRWQHISFLADVIRGTPGPSDETLAAGFFTEAEIASLTISPGHDDLIRDAFAAYRSGNIAAFFDMP
ncbi:MAG: NUDIX hydrolase N-terminal domain-containing protein [Chloroflexota bacterium]|nr:NUDIX hydrolase N-terminal domain-containing protein [Chloroflexota bacterium]